MRPLVIVRPEPGASATARAAEQLGLTAVVMPLFVVEPIEWEAPDPGKFDGLLLTSANAVRHAGAAIERFRSLPVHCVGQATAAAARDAGFSIAIVGNDGVDALLEAVPRGLRLLHLTGADRREPQSPKQSIQALAVYRATELPAPEGLEALEDAVIAVHSPRAASRLAELPRLQRKTIAIAAISSEAAAAAGPGWKKAKAAAEPTDTALLALAARLCNNRS